MTQPVVSLLILCNNNHACIAIKEILGDLPFNLTICSTAEEALELLNKLPHDLIVAEYNIDSQLTGIDFLKKAAEMNPLSTRLIVGDKASEEIIVKAVIKGIACAYLDSSNNKAAIKAKLVDFARVQTSMDNPVLRNLNIKTNNFPIVMSIYEQLMNAINNNVTIGQIAKIVSSDVTLTSKILHVANSAFYGSFSGTSVEKAIIYMGLNTVRDIVLMHSLSTNLNMNSTQNAALESTVRHSTITNFYMHQIAHIYRQCELTTLNNSVGIIHDIGKLIQLVYFQQEHLGIEEYRKEHPSADYFTCENLSGNSLVSHADLGAYFLKLWNFNQYAIEATLFHHTPELASDNTKPCVEALYLANTLADIRDGYDLSLDEAVMRCTVIKADPKVLMNIPDPRLY